MPSMSKENMGDIGTNIKFDGATFPQDYMILLKTHMLTRPDLAKSQENVGSPQNWDPMDPGSGRQNMSIGLETQLRGNLHI